LKQPDGTVALEKSDRAFELDALRGLALLMMILHHLIYDLRYLLELPVFAFQESAWFINLLRPLFLCVFLVVSGICSTFSRSNLKRGLRTAAAALAFTAATAIVSIVTQFDLYIFFNVLHLLALGTLLYAWITRKDRGKGTDVLLIILTATIIWAATILPTGPVNTYLLLPFGLLPATLPGMSDYLPIFPWLGFFFAGTLIGRLRYADRRTAFPNVPAQIVKATRPLTFLGRHSLLIYALHQPVLLALLFGLRAAGLI
jgi:uncharacterized membrane protein